MHKKTTKILLLLAVIFSMSIHSVLALDNTDTVGSGTVYTNDAFYYSDQFMWKASLFVAKADTVNRADASMADFHRIGSEAVYLSPVSDWSGWVGGSRPSNIKSLEFTTGNKMDTLQELKSKGGDVNALDPVGFTNAGGVNWMYGMPKIDGEDLPYPPQMCDGVIYDNGVVKTDYVGNITKVTNYFGNSYAINAVLNYYAIQQGKTPQDLVSELEFTINGETRSGWEPEGILPKAVAGGVTDTDSNSWNHVNQVEWLIVYEPCTIVYTRVAGGYKGYVMTATDFAVTQIKKQMDWRYDETRMSSWAGLQPDAWAPNGDRQHVARLSHLVVGNSVIIKEGWYGLDATGNKVDQNAAPPFNRWTSENELKYGGWGMSLWEKPKTSDRPMNYDFNADTDVIYATDIFSNIETKPGQEITVTYEIGGNIYTDTVIAPLRQKVLSYFKWHTPDVDVVTTYDLKITVSPFPKATLDGDGNEYVHRTITVRPLSEKTPSDPKVLDTLPPDFIPDHVPGTVVGDDTLTDADKPTVKTVSELSSAPYYINDTVKLNVTTNRVTEWIDFKNVKTGDTRQMTSDSVGNGFLVSIFENKLNDTITWTLEFTMANFGDNAYAITPGSSSRGMGDAFIYNLQLSEDPDNPAVFSVDISPKPPLSLGFYYLYTDTKSPDLEYTVYYDTDDGTVMDPIKVKANTLIPVPTNPVKEGHDFKGWYKNKDFTELWDFDNALIKGVTTLYAKFEIKTYTVSFNTNGKGMFIPPVSTEYGCNILEPTRSLVEGYVFEGWYKDAGFTNKWNFDSDVVISDITLYANWIPHKFSVVFEENGGQIIPDLLMDFNSLVPTPVCERVGYTLDKWYQDETFNSPWNFLTDRLVSDLILYAKWNADPATIAFEENGGSEVMDLVGVTDQVITDTTMPETLRPGYTFEGWFETDNFAGSAVSQLPEKFPAGEITYYAKWKVNASEIIFEENGGSEVTDLIGVTDQVITDTTMPETLRPGYTFEGWFETDDFDGSVISQLPEKFPPDGITYFAKWNADVSIIHYEENGAMLIPDRIGLTDQTITDREMPNITRDGYTFEGWFETDDFDGSAVWQLPEKFPAGEITYYAKWKTSVSSIIFIENGGSITPDLTGIVDEVIVNREMPETLRPGYTFEGWFETDDFDGSAVWQLPNQFPAGDITYYAKWEAKVSIIHYEENGAMLIPDRIGVTDQTITDTTMPNITRDGYTFEGWFETDDFDGSAVSQLPEKFPVGDITYYAKWNANVSTIYYEENGGTLVPDRVGWTDWIIFVNREMPETLRPGYTFMGWFETDDFDGSAVWQLPNQFPAGDITYYAKWEAKVSIIHYEENGAMLIPDLVGLTDQTITDTTMPNITRDGYTFEGWFETDDFDGSAVSQLPEKFPAGEITYYAKWGETVLDDYTWEEIIAIANAGEGELYFKIGQTKDLQLSTNEILTMQIYGFNHDIKADNTGAANITFGTKDLMKDMRRVNPTGTNNYGWNGSELRGWMNGINTQYAGTSYTSGTTSLYSQLPAELQDGIKSVKKLTSSGNKNNALVTSTDKLFAFSEVELFGAATYSFAGEGAKYPIFTDNASRIKDMNDGSGSGKWYWCRSPWSGNNISFTKVHLDGSSIGNQADSTNGVAFGFSLGNDPSNFTTYTVTYNSNGGSAVDPPSTPYLTTITAPTPPTRELYVFDGWFKDEACTTAWNFDADVVTSDITLYAKWHKKGLADYSWDEIKLISESGKADDYFDVKDEKTAIINGQTYTFQIYGFTHDDKAVGSGKAGITFGLKGLMVDKHFMNPSSYNYNYDGWDGSDMRAYLNGVATTHQNTSYATTSIYSKLPADLKAVITPVKKYTSGGYSNQALVTSTDNLFLFSEEEVGFGNYTYSTSGEGTQYPIFTDNTSRIKRYPSNSTGAWWLRSADNSYKYNFLGVRTAGTLYDYNANSINGVAFGFCI